ncbi:tetratricopeptide repeat protein [Actinosynnema sp. NPDC023794]
MRKIAMDHSPGNHDPQPAQSTVHNAITGDVGGHVLQTGTVVGDVHLHAPLHATPVPRQLPAAPRRFTGRVEELNLLTAALDDAVETGATMVISALGGVGGIGKTWLALHWAHQHADRFPDGQLFVDLRGFTPSAEPMRPAEAVRGFLDALGVDPAGIPVDLNAQVGLYRSLVAGRRMLIVLDNARDTAQVVSLLPGSSTCTVLVTSRRHLAGLSTAHGAWSLDLAMLPEAEAHQLLVDCLGADRVAAEPDAVAELMRCCAGLPLALGIVAARATMHPHFPLAVLAEELRDSATRLDGLEAGEISLDLRAVFSWSYEALPVDAATVFGLLGLAPGPDISLHATASLIGLPPARTRGLLRELETSHLVTQPVPGRYRLHDLIRLSARAHATRDQSPDDLETALRRLIDFYLHTAHAAEQLLNPHRPPIDVAPPHPDCLPRSPSNRAAALAWFETEHPCVLAVQQLAAAQGRHKAAWQLAWTLTSFHFQRGHAHDDVAAWQVGLAAAQHQDDPAVLLLIRVLLGEACSRVGRHADALGHLSLALRMAQDAADVRSQAHAQRALARASERQGKDQRAFEHAAGALRLYRALDQPIGEAITLNMMGRYSTRLGHYDEARAYCEAALALCRRHNHREAEADTLDSLGYLAHLTGHLDDALDYYQQALVLCRTIGHTYYEAGTLDYLGQTHASLGNRDQARHAWDQALRLYRNQHRANEAARIQRLLHAVTEPEQTTDPGSRNRPMRRRASSS